MSKATLIAHEKRVAEARAAEAEADKRRELRKAVKDVLPRNVRIPKRGKGRTPSGGISKRELAAIRARAVQYLDGEGGLAALQAEIQLTAIVILLIDGVIGTEPWRVQGGPHAGIITANARMRYLDSASKLLEDMQRARGSSSDPQARLTDGVFDAEIVTSLANPPEPTE